MTDTTFDALSGDAGDRARDSRKVAAPPVLTAQGLSREFDGRGVLASIDLEIRAGEFVALLGRSGSGKSTLLRILTGLDDDYRGAAATPASKAVVFQDPRLLPWATVGANVALGLRGPAARERAREALAEVGLADHVDAWPRTLSGGEAQRAALARALVRAPELLLLDEPFGALDALTRIHMHGLLRELCRMHQPATLLVTHDVDEAIVLADRVIVLTDGTLSFDRRVDLPGTNRRRHPGFEALREELFTELGVEYGHY